ncbi:YybS family protein [Planococcus sp. NCCP-2050]|uniref:YybS family protein n=1 Tax=Planococcus sp. NCCP-2050 TaxID=2944679 RepID=UPI00203A5DE8|nr:YybS family protein [Planococcus sp. NCCP-2050]GKW46148.1 membrane protein [Planococcus sp. NCCP-2050]
MQNQQTRQLTQGAMMAAVFTVLLAISIYVPLLQIVSSLFLALPIAWYSAKYGGKASALFTAVCLVLTFIIGGILSLPLALIHIPLGLVIGLSIYNRKSKLFMFMGSSIVILISLVVQYVASIALLGINVLEEFMTEMKSSFQQTSAIMENFGTLPEDYTENMNQLLLSMEILMPTWLVLGVFMATWVMLLLLLPVLKRLGIEVPAFPPFREMKLPKSVLWYYLIVIVVSVFTEFQPGTMPYMILMNATLMLQFLLFLQGISFYHYYIKQEGWPKWVTVIVTILAIPLQSFTSIVGIVDLGFDIRGWVKRAHEFKGK